MAKKKLKPFVPSNNGTVVWTPTIPNQHWKLIVQKIPEQEVTRYTLQYVINGTLYTIDQFFQWETLASIGNLKALSGIICGQFAMKIPDVHSDAFDGLFAYIEETITGATGL